LHDLQFDVRDREQTQAHEGGRVKKLNEKLVTVIRNFLSGSRLAKFNESIKVLNESIADGQWIKRGSVKAESGFYQGVQSRIGYRYEPGTRGAQDASALYFCLQYGHPFSQHHGKNLELGIKTIYQRSAEIGKPLRVPQEVVRAWVDLCAEKDAASKELTEARPKPVLTKIGLSPKVTKTLKEMDLDIDISSIKMPPVKYYLQQAYDDKTGKFVFNPDKTKKMERVYYVEWPNGTEFNATRFNDFTCCEACGKFIPSKMFVPILAKDNKSKKHVGIWLGCDCARNIFGVRDIGVRGRNVKRFK